MQPNLTQILIQMANLTQLNPKGPTRPKNRLYWVQIKFIKYIIGLNPNLNPFLGQADAEGQPDLFEPQLGPNTLC